MNTFRSLNKIKHNLNKPQVKKYFKKYNLNIYPKEKKNIFLNKKHIYNNRYINKDINKLLMCNGADYDLNVCDTKIYNSNYINSKLFEMYI